VTNTTANLSFSISINIHICGLFNSCIQWRIREGSGWEDTQEMTISTQSAKPFQENKASGPIYSVTMSLL